jgi:hypothetical protein
VMDESGVGAGGGRGVCLTVKVRLRSFRFEDGVVMPVDTAEILLGRQGSLQEHDAARVRFHSRRGAMSICARGRVCNYYVRGVACLPAAPTLGSRVCGALLYAPSPQCPLTHTHTLPHPHPAPCTPRPGLVPGPNP